MKLLTFYRIYQEYQNELNKLEINIVKTVFKCEKSVLFSLKQNHGMGFRAQKIGFIIPLGYRQKKRQYFIFR